MTDDFTDPNHCSLCRQRAGLSSYVIPDVTVSPERDFNQPCPCRHCEALKAHMRARMQSRLKGIVGAMWSDKYVAEIVERLLV